MTKALSTTEMAGAMAFQMDEGELLAVLRNSLYPGAADASIKLVMSYCKASGLDPMQKPVHIVQMWDSKSRTMRDVIMPGIGLYRTQAARSRELAGVGEPEFGPEISANIGGVNIKYPEWCRATIKRGRGKNIAEFTVVERWIENYIPKGGKERSIAPNAMWTKRPYGQLAKCTTAQAFRTAFPEMTGAHPTADEMEGREINGYASDPQDADHGTQDENHGTYEVRSKQAAPANGKAAPILPGYSDEKFETNSPKWRAAIERKRTTPKDIINMISTVATLSKEQKEAIEAMGKPATEGNPAADEFFRDTDDQLNQTEE